MGWVGKSSVAVKLNLQPILAFQLSTEYITISLKFLVFHYIDKRIRCWVKAWNSARWKENLCTFEDSYDNDIIVLIILCTIIFKSCLIRINCLWSLGLVIFIFCLFWNKKSFICFLFSFSFWLFQLTHTVVEVVENDWHNQLLFCLEHGTWHIGYNLLDTTSHTCIQAGV